MSGYIGVRNVPTLLNGGGVWSMNEVAKFRKDGVWPLLNDPYFSSVSLLLPMTGANDSTTFTDVSSSPKTATPYGNAKISTAQSKWGNGSGYFDGNGDYVLFESGDGFKFSTSPFTIESWIYVPTHTAAVRTILSRQGSSLAVQLRLTAANKLESVLRQTTTPITLTTTDSVPEAQWVHVALCRTSGLTYLFINGVSSASSSVSYDLDGTTEKLAIGSLYITGPTISSYFSGYMQDLRITKGVGRYTANFTPPTTPFPRS